MIANIIWKTMNAVAGTVGAKALGAPPTRFKAEEVEPADEPCLVRPERERVADERPSDRDDSERDERLHDVPTTFFARTNPP